MKHFNDHLNNTKSADLPRIGYPMETKLMMDTCTVLENIQNHFEFLFRRGFHITSILFAGAQDEKWQVVLTAGDSLIIIHNDGERVGVSLSSLELCNALGFIELDEFIHVIEQERNPSHSPKPASLDDQHELVRIARSFENYMDDIWILMAGMGRLISNGNVRAIAENNRPDFFFRY